MRLAVALTLLAPGRGMVALAVGGDQERGLVGGRERAQVGGLDEMLGVVARRDRRRVELAVVDRDEVAVSVGEPGEV